jgi:cell division protein FtsZ
VNITSSDDLTLAETTEAMGYIQGLCDADDVNIYFGTVVDSSMENTVRITVLATGFEQGTPEAQVAKEAPTTVVVPQVAAVEPAPQVERLSVDRQSVERSGASRVSAPNPAEVFDDSDLDIPAFLREHRKRQNA